MNLKRGPVWGCVEFFSGRIFYWTLYFIINSLQQGHSYTPSMKFYFTEHVTRARYFMIYDLMKVHKEYIHETGVDAYLAKKN